MELVRARFGEHFDQGAALPSFVGREDICADLHLRDTVRLGADTDATISGLVVYAGAIHLILIGFLPLASAIPDAPHVFPALPTLSVEKSKLKIVRLIAIPEARLRGDCGSSPGSAARKGAGRYQAAPERKAKHRRLFLQFRAIACIRFTPSLRRSPPAQSPGTQQIYPRRNGRLWFRRHLNS